MKKKHSPIARLKGTFFLLCLLTASVQAVADVAITVSKFPDEKFRNFVKRYDTDGNNILSTAELNAVESMYLYNCNISSLDGIGYFPNLKTLNCDNNYLTTFDLLQNTKLESLTCRSQYASLTSMILPSSIKELNCSYNKGITTLNLSAFPYLQTLDCRNCGITTLIVSSTSPNLTLIHCYNNKLRGEAMTNFLNSLPFLMMYSKMGELNLIDGDSETEQNEVVAAAWYAALCAKGWICKGSIGYQSYTYDMFWDYMTNYVAINAKNFPDTNFRSYVRANCQNDGNTLLSPAEIAALQSINAPDRDIASLKGIELLTEVTTLSCFDNLLTSLDVSHNTKLTTLYCYNNSLETLKIPSGVKTLDCHNNNLSTISGLSSCSQLTTFNCAYNSFITLTVSNFSKLTSLNCNNNPQLSTLQCQNNSSLAQLALSNLSGLAAVYCNNNALTSLTINYCPNILTLNCKSNNLTALDVSNKEKLITLDCSHNTQLATLDVDDCRALENLNASYCTQLREFVQPWLYNLKELNFEQCSSLRTVRCGGNKVSSISFSGCSSLRYVSCYGNKLTSLNVSGLTNLKELDCYNNSIHNINLSGCSALETLSCHGNEMQSLNLAGLSNLSSLDCHDNLLTGLNLDDCPLLRTLNCSYNHLTELNLQGKDKLRSLSIGYNDISHIDLSPCPQLSTLNCYRASLTSLNLSSCTSLTELNCRYNNLSSLNLSACTNITRIICGNNRLASITLPPTCPRLYLISCFDNRLGNAAMNSLIASLPTLDPDGAYIYDEEGNIMDVNEEYGRLVVRFFSQEEEDNEEHNVCTPQHVQDARAKNWNIVILNDYEYLDYQGQDLPTTIQPSLTHTQGHNPPPQFNLNGQRVANTHKGVTIVNGKKVIRR